MGIPDYETLMHPTLSALANGQEQIRSQIRDTVAAAASIGEDDLAEMLPSGKTTVFGSRVGWALTYMAQANLVTRPKRGVYVITDRGRKVLDENPDRVDNRVLQLGVEALSAPLTVVDQCLSMFACADVLRVGRIQRPR